MVGALKARVSARSWVRPLLVFAIFVCASILAWTRLPGTSRATFWAEDAEIFSARALGEVPTPAWIFTPYDGYVHAVPQLAADVLWALSLPLYRRYIDALEQVQRRMNK